MYHNAGELRTDSELDVTIFSPIGAVVASGTLKSSGVGGLDNMTQGQIVFPLPSPEPLAALGSIRIDLVDHVNGLEGGNSWFVSGVNVMAGVCSIPPLST